MENNYNFYRTQTGTRFFNLHVPALIDQLTKIAQALEKQNLLKEKELKENKKVWIKEQKDKKKYNENYPEINEKKIV